MDQPSLDFGLKLYPYLNEEILPEEQKNLTPVTKKKGRPKGLKTVKPKLELKEEVEKSNRNSGHWLK